MDITRLALLQRNFFNKDTTKDISYRKNALIKLRQSLKNYEDLILQALGLDLGKSHAEAYMSEIMMAFNEIDYMLKNLNHLAKPTKVKGSISSFPSKSVIYHEPYGVVLIFSPWNYPLQLCLLPLIGAIAAGNCALICPSTVSLNVSKIIEKLINETFPKEYVHCIYTSYANFDHYDLILAQKYDFIFFTGSERVGKVVMHAATDHLTPVVLELGGKSPCIVDETADISIAAQRIIWGKLMNAGQTCVAPDYILVHKSKKQQLIASLISSIHKMYTENPLTDETYPKIINQHHFHRLRALIEPYPILFGGTFDSDTLKMMPTLLDIQDFDCEIMKEEIFGPLLPILVFESLDQVILTLKQLNHPLALYLFTTSKENEKKVMRKLSFGGGCINDTVSHIINPNLPFGGVGASGMGAYHGKFSFATFSHQKSCLKRLNWTPSQVGLPPYTEKTLKFMRSISK
ncbi:MAG: aldehyde dehydrogenase [Oscillospiraceae bacterium]